MFLTNSGTDFILVHVSYSIGALLTQRGLNAIRFMAVVNYFLVDE